jgi:hypothetical protein
MDAQASEFVATVALLVVATVKVRGNGREQIKAGLEQELTTPGGEWDLQRFKVAEADVRIVELANAFNLRAPVVAQAQA